MESNMHSRDECRSWKKSFSAGSLFRKPKTSIMKNRLKITLSLTLALAAGTASLPAAYVFSSPNQTIVESFTGYGGTAAPTNWVLDTPGNTAPFFGQEGSVVDGTAGWRSYGVTSPTVSSDRSLGFLGNGTFGPTDTPATMTASYTNSTGTLLTGISIGYTGEQWLAQVSRTSFITVSYSLDGTTFLNLGSLRFDAPVIPSTGAPYVLDGNDPLNSRIFAPAFVNLSANPIADGSSFYVRFSYSGGSNGGIRQGLSIDDVTVTVVPEPATTALLLGAAAFILLYKRKRYRASTRESSI